MCFSCDTFWMHLHWILRHTLIILCSELLKLNAMLIYTLKTSIALTAFQGLNAWNHSLPGANAWNQKPSPGANMPGIRAFLNAWNHSLPEANCLDSFILKSCLESRNTVFLDIFYNVTPVTNMYNSEKYSQQKF